MGLAQVLISAPAVYIHTCGRITVGPMADLEVWYVGDLSGTITIPGVDGQYGLSGWTLFGPGGQGVPDGGTTVMLLGAALSALGMARRYIKS